MVDNDKLETHKNISAPNFSAPQTILVIWYYVYK